MELFGKEINYVESYESTSNFSFLEAGRDWLVYRSEVSSHTTVRYPELISTVDLILVGAMYFELVARFEKIIVARSNDEKSFDLAKKFDKGFEYVESSERVYKIESKNYSFYAVAAHLWIHEHNCQMRESFINKFDYDSYLNKYVKNWVKIK